MAAVEFDEATRVYSGASSPAVDRLSLKIADGEFLVLVGPSGCGKSTSLRMVAGLERVDSGAIRIGKRDISSLPPKNRDVAMVFQNYALYPHMTVAENMGFALKIAGVKRSEIQQRVSETAKLLELESLLERKPKALSGGQRQRVAMGRAIIRQPQAFLMDEPLSNLDAHLRVQTRTQIAALQQRLGITTLYVTHDQVEAMTMGHRVAVLRAGRLMQVDTPDELYERPANAFVASFIGSPAMNLIEVELVDGAITIGGERISLARTAAAGASKAGAETVTIGIRPEHLRIATSGIRVEVNLVESLGVDAYVYGTLQLSNSVRKDVVVRTSGRPLPKRGETVDVDVDVSRIHVFNVETGERLAV